MTKHILLIIILSTIFSIVKSQCILTFDKIIIEYSYYIVNERIEYTIYKDSIVSKNKVYKNESIITQKLNSIFDICLDSVDNQYSCYGDGIITRFTFYYQNKIVKMCFLSGNQGKPLIEIINKLNDLLELNDKIVIIECPNLKYIND